MRQAVLEWLIFAEFFVGILALACLQVAVGALLKDTTGHVSLNYEATEDGITVELIRGSSF